MNFFKKLFRKITGKPTTVQAPEMSNLTDADILSAPPADLFTAHDEPAPVPATQLSAVDAFMSRNFVQEGRIQGYTQHCNDVLALPLKALASAFRDAARTDMDRLDEEMFQVQALLIDVGDMLPTTRQKLELKQTQLHARLRDLKLQTELSVDCEGRISGALHDYTTGYRTGFQDYLQEQDFMKAPVHRSRPVTY